MKNLQLSGWNNVSQCDLEMWMWLRAISVKVWGQKLLPPKSVLNDQDTNDRNQWFDQTQRCKIVICRLKLLMLKSFWLELPMTCWLKYPAMSHHLVYVFFVFYLLQNTCICIVDWRFRKDVASYNRTFLIQKMLAKERLLIDNTSPNSTHEHLLAGKVQWAWGMCFIN